MSRPRRYAAALAVGAAAIGLAACGSSDGGGTIPKDDADALLAALTDVQESVDSQDCTEAQTNASQFVDQVDQLPADVGAKTKEQLREAGNNLVDLAGDPSQCEDDQEETTTTSTETDTGTSGAEGFEDGG